MEIWYNILPSSSSWAIGLLCTLHISESSAVNASAVSINVTRGHISQLLSARSVTTLKARGQPVPKNFIKCTGQNPVVMERKFDHCDS